MNDILITLTLTLILMAFLLVLGLFLIVIKIIMNLYKEDLGNLELAGFIPNKAKETLNQNEYTPGDAKGVEVPLTDFTPDFNKPINLKYTDSIEGHGVEVEEDTNGN